MHFEFAYYSCFLSYSFGIETTNTFKPPVARSKTISDSRPKWADSVPFFRAKQRKNHTLWGGTYLYGLNPFQGYKEIVPEA